MKLDTYKMVTDRICELLEQGLVPWAKPWKSVTAWAWSGSNGKTYSFLNQMLLADPSKKYSSLTDFQNDICGEWLTFHQVQERGGSVRKGEHGRKIVFYTPLTVKDEESEDEGATKTIPYLNVYTVFHIRQCENIEQKFHLDDEKLYDFSPDTTAESVAMGYITREGIKYEPVRGDRAYYRPSTDTIVTPLPEQFEDSAEYYSTLFHEMVHSTGHQKRLNRINGCAAFGDESYSTEELVAEIGSASLMATLNVGSEKNITKSASYIQNWLKALRNDKRMIVTASGRAEKAIRRILDIQS